MALDAQKLSNVFQSRPDIVDGIKKAADNPQSIQLFNAIVEHVHDSLQFGNEPAHKKRRVEVERTNGAPSISTNAADEPVLLVVKEISVSVPQRKKFEICMTANHLYARAPGTTAPIPAITHAWQDIEYIFYLPVPEKTQVQHNYVIFPKGTCLPSKTNPSTVEPLVFTIPAAAPKEGTVGGSEASSASAVSDTYKDLFHWAFDRRLKSAGNAVDIVSANPGKFHSMVRQAHRPNEKAVHINGFRGSKDGYLFFLETGILWGFKKPLIFIPLNRIAAISYTNILQITFNMVVEVFPADGDETENEELEFGMLDQQDYGGIDDYVKTHRLQDRSMAEQRKGKLQLAENKQGAKKNGEAAENGDATGDDGLTELERAQKEAEQQAQDEEDEDEEDYDPGSDGESEGSGSSSEEDDDDDDDAEGDGDADEDDEVSAAEEGGEDGEDGQENAAADDDDDDDEHIPVKPEPQEAKPQKPAPAARGWAAVGKKKQPQPPPSMDVDMDDEKFDVV